MGTYINIWAVGLAGVLATTPALADDTIDFVINDGKVVPSEDYAVMISVLGAAITVNGGPDVPVTVKAEVGSEEFTAWGDFGSPSDGDVNTHGPAQHFIYNQMVDANDDITVFARSWLPPSYGGGLHIEVDSSEQTRQVMVLRDGDPAPDIVGYSGQNAADFYIREYLADGQVNIDENQVIYLFELGTTRINQSDADFQDLIVMVTLGESVEALLSRFAPLYD